MKKLMIIIVLFVVLFGFLVGAPVYLSYKTGKTISMSTQQPKSNIRFLTKIQSTPTTVIEKMDGDCIVSDTDGELLNFRMAGNMKASIIKGITEGTKLTIIASQGDWYNVTWNDEEGWVNKNYCK